jgi:hypothetical protein
MKVSSLKAKAFFTSAQSDNKNLAKSIHITNFTVSMFQIQKLQILKSRKSVTDYYYISHYSLLTYHKRCLFVLEHLAVLSFFGAIQCFFMFRLVVPPKTHTTICNKMIH